MLRATGTIHVLAGISQDEALLGAIKLNELRVEIAICEA